MRLLLEGKMTVTIVIVCLTVILTALLQGCATKETKPVELVCKTETIVQDRYVPIDEGLVKPVGIIYPPEIVDAYALRAMYLAQRTRAKQCNGQLAEIAKLGQENGK